MPSISPHIACNHCPAVHHRLHRPPRNLRANSPTSNPQNPGFDDGVRKDFAGFARVIGLPRTCPAPGRTVPAHGANRHGRTRFVSVLTWKEHPLVALTLAIDPLPLTTGGTLVFKILYVRSCSALVPFACARALSTYPWSLAQTGERRWSNLRESNRYRIDTRRYFPGKHFPGDICACMKDLVIYSVQ